VDSEFGQREDSDGRARIGVRTATDIAPGEQVRVFLGITREQIVGISLVRWQAPLHTRQTPCFPQVVIPVER